VSISKRRQKQIASAMSSCLHIQHGKLPGSGRGRSEPCFCPCCCSMWGQYHSEFSFRVIVLLFARAWLRGVFISRCRSVPCRRKELSLRRNTNGGKSKRTALRGRLARVTRPAASRGGATSSYGTPCRSAEIHPEEASCRSRSH
jgi:hypothetical protein